MGKDLRYIIDSWPVGDKTNIRRITGDDGREKIQIRVCIDTFHGILEFECDGRPDGKMPYGRPFALDYFEEQCRRLGGSFALDHSQAQELFHEGSAIYHRYALLLQMGDYDRTIRDTERNMRLFRFVHSYAAEEEDRNTLEKWWPYIIRIHATAQALDHVSKNQHGAAIAALQAAQRCINSLAEIDDDIFEFETIRSSSALAELESRISQDRPLTDIEQLERLRDQAVMEEDYEEAAALRDRIELLRQHG